MGRVVHFEIHAEQPERAIAFYRAVMDWSFDRWDGPMPYWLITTGPDGTPGINGGLMPRMQPMTPIDGAPVNAYVCTVDVDVLADALERVIKAGGVTAVPTMPIPGLGWLAYCKDTEGNIFGLMQRDPKAGL